MRPGEHGELVLEGNLEAALFSQALVNMRAYLTRQAVDIPELPPVGPWEFIKRYPRENNAEVPAYLIKDPALVREALFVVRGRLQRSDFALFARFNRWRYLGNRIDDYERKLLDKSL